MIKWNDLKGSGLGLILKYYPGILPEGLRKPRKTSVRIVGFRDKI
jgi:hypothetical protein